MSTGGIILAVILSAITLIAVAAPFFSNMGSKKRAEGYTSLAAHYERVLTNIRDLEEDLALGKIQQSFYDEERAKYVAEGVSLLKQMETMQPASTMPVVTPAAHPEQIDLDDVIEQAVSARRKERQVS
ncbi:MAG: hypothetical protein AAFV33_24600 [Chloroflexota bacterium]